MIRAIFHSNPLLLWSLIVLPLLVSGPTILLARRNHRSIPLCLAFSSSLAIELVATLYPASLSAPAQQICTVQKDLVGAIFAAQGLMNIALYVPLGCFAALLGRRPIAAWTAATLLSATTEVTQAVTPGMGRSCDSGDLMTNSLGAAIGCLLAVAISLIVRRRRSGVLRVECGWRQLRTSAVSLAAGACILAIVSSSAITFISSNVGEDLLPGTAQTAAAAAAAHEFFGISTPPTHVQYIPGSFGQPGILNIATSMGNLTLSWPSKEVTSGVFGSQVAPSKNSRGISSTAAITDATAFVRAHFAWGLIDSFTIVSAGPPNTGSQDVEWRSRMDGVLMPMRLGVIVEANGQIGAFEAKEVPPPALPPVTVTKTQATAKALALNPGDTVTSSVLLAQQTTDGRWHVRWLFGLQSAATTPKPAEKVLELDATTGSVVK